MRIGITTTQVPFVRGGAELHAESLQTALRAAGHEAEIITVPFKWYPSHRIPQHMLACRLLQVDEFCGKKIDLLIAMKFPTYFMPHPNKVLWLTHQHRSAYNAWDSPIGDMIILPDGTHIRQLIKTADDALIPECKRIFTVSQGVADRLESFNGIKATPLYHPPPMAERLIAGEYGDYLLAPSRINEAKRQHLIVEALTLTKNPVKVKFLGSSDSPNYLTALKKSCVTSGIADRVDWLGNVSDSEKLILYANCRAVVFLPIDEDYGYITLEAMASKKAVVTCKDSGGPLDFVLDNENGFVCPPNAQDLADAFDRFWEEGALAQRMGANSHARYIAMNLTWDHVIDVLLS